MHCIDLNRAFWIAFGVLGLGAGEALAAVAIESLSVSPDVHVDLNELGGGTFADEDVAIDHLFAGTVTPANIGSLADSDEVVAYELMLNGDQLLCFDETVSLSGVLPPRPGDVVRYDGVSWSLEFDASANGVPDGVVCDAVTIDGQGGLFVSFDTTVVLTAGGGTTLTLADEDILEVTGLLTFGLAFDGSAEGVPDRMDVDGARLLEDGSWLFSFDVTGNVGGIDFDDEDLARFDPVSGGWSMAMDLSARDADWGASDVDAIEVPEPSAMLTLVCGAVLLAFMRRRREGLEAANPGDR
jgi:hypothetical protein